MLENGRTEIPKQQGKTDADTKKNEDDWTQEDKKAAFVEQVRYVVAIYIKTTLATCNIL